MNANHDRSSTDRYLCCWRTCLAFCVLCLQPFAIQSARAKQQVASAPSKTYRLQSGDTISVFYRLTPEYNQSLTILPDGYVNLRLIGPVQVAGLDVEQARQSILAEANKRLRNPDVSVSVTEFVRAQFTVMGEVGRAGRYELHGSTSVVDALATAGGFTPLSAQRKVVLVRPLGPDSEYGNVTIFDFKQLTRHNAATPVPELRSGDIVIVTTSKYAKISGIIKLLNLGLYYNPIPTL